MAGKVKNNEAERLAALRSYGIVDSPPQAAFDRIVRMTARIFDMPIVLISLLDEDRQWFKAAVGFDEPETPREHAFCSQTVESNAVLVVPDASEHAYLACNPYVTMRDGIRFYAGAPIINPDGFRLGSLCLVDTKPRDDFSERDTQILRDMAATVSEQIELQYAANRVRHATAQSRRAEQARAESDHVLGVFLKDVPVAVAMFDRAQNYVAASRRWCKRLGVSSQGLRGRYLRDVHPDLPEAWREQHEMCLSGKTFFVEEEELTLPGGTRNWFRRTVYPWQDQHGNLGGIIIVMVDLDAHIRARKELQASRHFIEAILQNVNEGIVACDGAGTVSLANRAAERILGFDAGPPIPLESWRDAFQYYRSGSTTPIASTDFPLVRLMRGETVEAEEYRLVGRGGTDREVLVHGAAMREPTGETIGAVVSIRDVTEERAIVRRWREADALYKATFNNTVLYSSIVDLDFRLVEINQRSLENLGETRENLIGRLFTDDALWRNARHEIPRLERSLRMAAAGQSVNYELFFEAPNGWSAPFDFSLTPVLNDAGEVTYIIAEGRDLSDRKASESALSRKTAELELIFNHVPIRIFYKDDRNRIIRLNQPAADSLGLSLEEAEGGDTYALFPEHAAQYHARDLEVINSGEPALGIVEPYSPKGGKPGWTRTDKVPHVDPETGERFLFVASVDITAERAAVEALREREESYRLLYNKTPVMLQSIDREGQIVSVSDHWLERLGYRRDEVIGRLATDFVRDGASVVLPWHTDARVSKDGEIDLVARNGTLITVLLSAVGIWDDDHNITLWLTSQTDITDRKRIEAQLFQASKMESVGQLTGGLAHDFNNLLCIVLGNLQLMERRIGNDASLGPLLNSAVQAVRSGSELTQRLLSVSRGKPVASSEVDVAELVTSLHDLLRRALGSHVELSLAIETENAVARTDRSQLEAAILNLAINARDAMISNGRLTVRVSMIEQVPSEPELDPGHYVVLTVTDNGAGIPPEVLPRVLEPFFTTKPRGKGSGLGLAMIYGFMRQSGGTVRIESEVGRGTSVALYLPATRAGGQHEEPAGVSATAQVDLRGATVLVAEDQDNVRATIVALLKEGGCNTITAASGPEGFEIIRSGVPIDVLLTDIVMPGEYNGVGLARRTKAQRPDLPILFATGYAEDTVREAARLFSDQPIMQKPITGELLLTAIARALGAVDATRRRAALETSS